MLSPVTTPRAGILAWLALTVVAATTTVASAAGSRIRASAPSPRTM